MVLSEDLVDNQLAHVSLPQWELPLKLEALVTVPYEHLECSSLQALTFKEALQLVLTLVKRVVEQTALLLATSR